MIVALDVGERRIGVAISDPSERYALPAGTIQRTALRADLEAIIALAREHRAGTIVVGDPVALSGERSIAAQKMDDFVRLLAKVWDGPIERIDERLTTAQAARRLVDADVPRKKRKRLVDQLAAGLILEAYLARRRRLSP